jgi:hypothetical protein
MKKDKNLEDSLEINRKIVLTKEILNNVYEILALFKPMFDLMLEMEEAKIFRQNGTFTKAAELLGEISDSCKELEGKYLLH